LTFGLAPLPAPAQPTLGTPGQSHFGTLIISGPSFNTGLSNYGWQINDAGPSITFPNAPGVAGPKADANSEVSGWSLLEAVKVTSPVSHKTSTGDFYWDATPDDALNIMLITLAGPRSKIGAGQLGPMSDFDPNQSYVWPIVTFEGAYKTDNTAAYPNGPPTDAATLTASTNFVVSSQYGGFANPHSLPFSLVMNLDAKELDLVYGNYTPASVPEPGTFALTGLGLLAAWRFRRHGKWFPLQRS
jgi:hypothetical protein